MAPSIGFRGAFIRNVHIVNPPEGEKYTRAYVSSDFTDTVQNKMDWGGVDESVTSAKLKGKLLAINLILTPADKELKKHALDLDIKTVSNFEVVGMKGKDGETMRRELRFTVDSAAADAGAFLENYVNKLGREPGFMKVSYTKQESLDLEGEGEPDGEDVEQTEEESGDEEPTGGPTLASARELGLNSRKKSS